MVLDVPLLLGREDKDVLNPKRAAFLNTLAGLQVMRFRFTVLHFCSSFLTFPSSRDSAHHLSTVKASLFLKVEVGFMS